MGNIKKSRLQPPVRESDLLNVYEFIKHCEWHGIRTDSRQLEFYERRLLLLPAVRVLPLALRVKQAFKHVDLDSRVPNFDNGSVLTFDKFVETAKRHGRRVGKRAADSSQNGGQLRGAKGSTSSEVEEEPDPRTPPPGKKTVMMYVPEHLVASSGFDWVEDQTYYMPDEIDRSEDGWLEAYKKRQRVRFPACHRFTPWVHYQAPNVVVTNQKHLAHAYQTFYSKLQMYPLSLIQRTLTCRISDRALFCGTQEWKGLLQDIRRHYAAIADPKIIRRKVSAYYSFFNLVYDVEDLWQKRNKIVGKRLEKPTMAESKLGGAFPKAKKDETKDMEEEVDYDLREEATAIMKQYKASIESLNAWAQEFAYYGTFGLGKRENSAGAQYLSMIRDDALARTEHPYNIVKMLNWLKWLCCGQKESISELVFKETRYRVCRFCGRVYHVTRQDQLTCGRKDCDRERSKELKTMKRATGDYLMK